MRKPSSAMVQMLRVLRPLRTTMRKQRCSPFIPRRLKLRSSGQVPWDGRRTTRWFLRAVSLLATTMVYSHSSSRLETWTRTSLAQGSKLATSASSLATIASTMATFCSLNTRCQEVHFWLDSLRSQRRANLSSSQTPVCFTQS